MFEPLDYHLRVEMISLGDRWEMSVKYDRWREGVGVRTWIFFCFKNSVGARTCTCLSPDTRSSHLTVGVFIFIVFGLFGFFLG